MIEKLLIFLAKFAVILIVVGTLLPMVLIVGEILDAFIRMVMPYF